MMTKDKDNRTIKRAICLLIVGKKYQRQYKLVKSDMEEYAKKCSADIVIIDKAPDPKYHRNILSQKLLIPAQVSHYDMVLFLDIDIRISPSAPNIFNEMPDDKSFGAILDPRGTTEFRETWKHDKRIIEETSVSYFTTRNFEDSNHLMGCINGGVLIFKPANVEKLFSEYYFSNHNQGKYGSYEEAPMAYLTQVNNIFFSLDIRYNQQIMYKLKGSSEGNRIIKEEQRIPKFLRKIYYKYHGCKFVATKCYKKLAMDLLEQNYFVHFAGKYPFHFNFNKTHSL